MSSSDRRWRCLLKVVTIVGIVRADSSAEYLQQAMIDLQQFNVPASYSPVKEYDRYNDPIAATQQLEQEQLGQRRTGLQGNLFGGGTSNVERLVLTPEDLAKMYKNALANGTPLSASTLRNALSSGSGPRVKGNHVELTVAQEEEHRPRKPVYRYYFFPLETFANGFSRDHNFPQQTQQLPAPPSGDSVTSGSVQSGPKELANPLFLAISSFVGIALLFMTGVLFLPKLGKLGGFEGRHLQDELLRLTNAVLNASQPQANEERASVREYARRQERRAAERLRRSYANKRTRERKSRRDATVRS